VISTSSLPLIHAGKVRRLYALDDPNEVLIVATDAISAYDQVLETPIPDKGAILTQLSVWWSGQLRDIVPDHLISTDVPVDVQGRAIVAERLEMIPVECVARGYITGSGWAEYQVNGTIAGLPLPPGLQHADRLPEPIFTPARKAPQGEHDENISYAQLIEMVGSDVAEQLRDLTLALFARGARIAAERDIILADTKFEFGRRADGTIVLADEILTPDSSRFWDAAQWTPGAQVPSFDKQYVRDWLAYDSGWDKTSDTPAPPLPTSVVEATRDRYLEAYNRLTGRQFAAAKAGTTPAALLHEAAGRYQPKTRYIVDVMPKPEILDPQGKAVTGALTRMGYEGYSVRQGKRFEVETTRGESAAVLAEIQAFAEALLANTVIENFAVSVDRPGLRPEPVPTPAIAVTPAPSPAVTPAVAVTPPAAATPAPFAPAAAWPVTPAAVVEPAVAPAVASVTPTAAEAVTGAEAYPGDVGAVPGVGTYPVTEVTASAAFPEPVAAPEPAAYPEAATGSAGGGDGPTWAEASTGSAGGMAWEAEPPPEPAAEAAWAAEPAEPVPVWEAEPAGVAEAPAVAEPAGAEPAAWAADSVTAGAAAPPERPAPPLPPSALGSLSSELARALAALQATAKAVSQLSGESAADVPVASPAPSPWGRPESWEA
jgi:phosphoribosylaminoimidazole-succinocarboxamide synthase